MCIRDSCHTASKVCCIINVLFACIIKNEILIYHYYYSDTTRVCKQLNTVSDPFVEARELKNLYKMGDKWLNTRRYPLFINDR